MTKGNLSEAEYSRNILLARVRVLWMVMVGGQHFSGGGSVTQRWVPPIWWALVGFPGP